MSEGWIILLGLTPMWVILIAPIIWPSMVSAHNLNTQGQLWFLDRAFFKTGLWIAVAMSLFSAFKQGESGWQIGLMAIGIGFVIALLIGFWGHIIWRRQQRLLHPHPDWLPARSSRSDS